VSYASLRNISSAAFLILLLVTAPMAHVGQTLPNEQREKEPEIDAIDASTESSEASNEQSDVNLLGLKLAQSLAIADFNGDGISDVAVADFLHDVVVVMVRDRDGRFTTTASLATGHGPRSIVARDFDLDGAVDIAVANFFSGDVRIFVGESGGHFREARTYRLDPGVASLSSNDFDGDGDADLAVANFLSGQVTVLDASGGGTFERARIIGRATGTTLILNRDANGDGVADLLALDASGQNVRLFAGQPGGSFEDAGRVEVEVAFPNDSDSNIAAPGDSLLTVHTVSGDGLAARIGSPFPEALIVELRDLDGAVIGGEAILFSNVLGRDDLTDRSQWTNEDGQASLQLLAANLPQSQFVAAAAQRGSVVVAGSVSTLSYPDFREAIYEAIVRMLDPVEGERQRVLLEEALERLTAGDDVRAVATLMTATGTRDLVSEVVRRLVNQVLLIGPASPGPDLVETTVSNPPAAVTLKDKFTVTDTVENVGTGPAGASTTRYYLSTDGVQKTTRLGGGGRSVPGLNSGSSSSGSDIVTVPVSTKPRSYFLLACADDRKVVLEDDEGNNCRASASQVEVRAADLIVTAVSDPPASASVGSSFSASDTTKNNGNWPAGSSTTRYFLSLDTKKSSGDVRVGSRIVPSLGPGDSSTNTVTATIPTSTSPNKYFLLACADALKKVVEGNAAKTGEKNNCLASTGKIDVIAGDGGPLGNGALMTGRISVAGEIDEWTFNANAGDRIAIHIGEIVDDNDFRPWIRLRAPDSSILGNTWGTDAAVIDDVVAPITGTYGVLVASADSGFDGTGTYRLTMTHTPGPITVSPGDQGGPLTNGAMHTGEIVQGDVDVWTFTATAGDRIAVHIGETTDTDDFRPWIRLWAPNGASRGDTWDTDAAVIDDAVALVTGTYLVLVASADSGFDGTGTYRLTMTHTPGPITVSPGDQGGPLTNGAMHTGEILQGDVDVWTFTANAGDRIAVHIGETTDTDDFRPWIRLWAPDGASRGDTWDTDAAVIDDAVALVTGTYLVLVASADSGFDGTGTYRLTMTHTPGPITVSEGDQGGPLTNGAMHTGEIVQGDVDVWTITANAGDSITVDVSQTSETDDFRPWIRLWAPNGASRGDTWGTDGAQIAATASVTGTYLVLVASADSGFNGTGTYSLTVNVVP
jgi:hypothetical protein